MQGDGEMSYANGDTYKGQWLNAKPHGQGEIKFSSEDCSVLLLKVLHLKY